jgi:ATP-dependent DNA helicase PIF1
MVLTKDQQTILEAVKKGENILITGGAGTGKSFLINEICNYFNNVKINYGVCALTGCAAVLINSRTLHSLLGIGLAKGTPQELYRRIRKMDGKLGYLLNIRALVIDEISMLSDNLFDKIADLFKIIHSSDRPFGKVQIILVGDLSQLPPVEGEFCFKATNWDPAKIVVKILTKSLRTSDQKFEDLLNRLRWGICTPGDLELLKNNKNEPKNGITFTKLFSRNCDVDCVNNYELAKLIKSGNPFLEYPVRYSTNPLKLKTSTEYIISQKIPEKIKVAVGSQVMITRNLDFDLDIINGTRGIVTDICADYISLKLVSGEMYNLGYFHVKPDPFDTILVDNKLDFKYIPLVLSWAITIHKSQGMTIDALEVDLGETIFANGQGYTAISRARSLESINITKVSPRAFNVSKDVFQFYQKYNNESK